MMAELAKNPPVYSFLPSNNNYKISKGCVILFGFRKGKTGNLVVPSKSTKSRFWINLLNTRDRKSLIFLNCGL